MTAMRLLRKGSAFLLAVCLFALSLLAPPGAGAKGPTIIRDAEIEDTIRAYATPLFRAAGLNPSAIEVYLIQDNSLNAFVTGGMRMFIHTGLLMRADDPLEVIGVIAHETGHISGGHIAARIQEQQQASTSILATYVLGLGAALATGRGEIAAAVLRGGQDIALKNILSYSRGHEQAADQAAVRLLRATKQSPQGLLDFMRVLGGQEVLLAANQDPYLRTHPMSIDRINFLERAVAESPYAGAPASPELQGRHARLRAKLIGYLWPLPQVFRAYPKDDRGLHARYAHAIAYYRQSDLNRALALIEELLEEYPEDPFFHELKGQMLFEHGKLAEGRTNLETAVRLRPEAPQLRVLLARILIEMNSPELDREALQHLQQALRYEEDNAFAWRLSAIAYGRAGDQGMTALAMGESALNRGAYIEARSHAKRALDILPAGTPSWLQADDLFNQADQLAAK